MFFYKDVIHFITIMSTSILRFHMGVKLGPSH